MGWDGMGRDWGLGMGCRTQTACCYAPPPRCSSERWEPFPEDPDSGAGRSGLEYKLQPSESRGERWTRFLAYTPLIHYELSS
jgi:hypothetical protein